MFLSIASFINCLKVFSLAIYIYLVATSFRVFKYYHLCIEKETKEVDYRPRPRPCGFVFMEY